jgi:hypothetical protein
MSALRPARRDEERHGATEQALPPQDSPDWLTLQQAACEMGVSMSTVRRMVRGGRLLNRMVPHRGGFAYLVFIPGSRHGSQRQHEPKRRRLWLVQPTESPEAAAEHVDPERKISELEHQLDQMAHALSRALRTKQRALPAGMGEPDVNPKDPYARYRWLRRKRRWWPFGSRFGS